MKKYYKFLLVFVVLSSMCVTPLLRYLFYQPELAFPKCRESKYCTEEYVKGQLKLYREIDSLREIRERTYYLIIINPTK